MVARWLPELHHEIEGLLSFLLVSHWPEMGHVTTSASKGCWGCKLLTLLLQPPAGQARVSGGCGVREVCQVIQSVVCQRR